MHLVSFERVVAHGRARDPHRLGDAALGNEALEPLRPGARRVGALLEGGPHAGHVVDLNQSLAIKLAFDDVGAPEAEADSLVPADMLKLLRRGPRAMAAVRTALDFATRSIERYDGPDFERAGAVEPLDHVRLCAPLERPGKIVCAADNYADDRDAPSLYLKAPTAVAGPHDDIVLPALDAVVRPAGGLAVVIGERARCVRAEEALACAAGYTIAGDFGWLRGDPDPGRLGRSCDTFCPTGPSIVTADEIVDPQSLSLRTSLCGRVQVTASTKEMRWTVAEIVARASQWTTLEPGDLVFTGSPGAAAMERELRDGDVVESAIEGLGRLANYVRAR